MTDETIKKLLSDVQTGILSAEDAHNKFKSSQYEDLGFAKIDYQREARTGFPEVIFCQSKTIEQIAAIIKNMQEHEIKNIMGTRVTPEVYEQLKLRIPNLKYYTDARIISIKTTEGEPNLNPVAVVTGGTADIPVAEEAAVTLELFGNKVLRVYDAGVAGLHRLINNLGEIRSANVVIAVAGMEGALASVVAGLVACPVIAVPTSVGYGASFGGVAALLCMLNSCANGVSVVNIDNGFGAAYNAAIINKIGTKK